MKTKKEGKAASQTNQATKAQPLLLCTQHFIIIPSNLSRKLYLIQLSILRSLPADHSAEIQQTVLAPANYQLSKNSGSGILPNLISNKKEEKQCHKQNQATEAQLSPSFHPTFIDHHQQTIQQKF